VRFSAGEGERRLGKGFETFESSPDENFGFFGVTDNEKKTNVVESISYSSYGCGKKRKMLPAGVGGRFTIRKL